MSHSSRFAENTPPARLAAATAPWIWNLVVLRNVLELAVRRGQLKSNPLVDRGQYTDESTVRHCREVAPTPAGW